MFLMQKRGMVFPPEESEDRLYPQKRPTKICFYPEERCYKTGFLSKERFQMPYRLLETAAA